MSTKIPETFGHLAAGPAEGRPDFKWTRRDVAIGDRSGVVWRQDGVEAPATWSDRAVEQPSRLYFRVVGGKREASIWDMTVRVVDAIGNAAAAPNRGGDKVSAFGPLVADGAAFKAELAGLFLTQRFAWNTPVWVNAGAPLPPGEKPQCSACFIQSVGDDMESITALQTSETMLFRRGSGTGTDFSPLRPKDDPLSRGGTASGPTSFMLAFDGWARATKSGGASRRAAKMNVLRAEHPDVFDFVTCKVRAGKMIGALVGAGWDGDWNAEATSWAAYQNANHSVRVTDRFMEAVREDLSWDLRFPVDSPAKSATRQTIRARDLWEAICSSAHACGDPGLQFDGPIQAMHTCPAAGPIRASNPCSEYLFLDDSACNLASLNLVKFWDPGKGFLTAEFGDAVDLAITSMEAIVDLAGYPTPRIAENSRRYRTLGLGYANLGALLMRAGVPYDSPDGRGIAAAITSFLGARAYLRSAQIARDCGGPFPAWEENRETMLSVVEAHARSARELADRDSLRIADAAVPAEWRMLAGTAAATWDAALRLGREFGFRNAQTTLLAPTGTISFMMDCDTTGVESDTGLVRYKRLAGGGNLKLVNGSVGPALRRLGYSDARASSIVAQLERGEGLSELVREEDRAVFACSFGNGEANSWPILRPEAHVLMVAAVQPFLSGAVSKTCNLPAGASAEDVARLYMLAWERGLKAVAVYVDGAKGSQPLTTSAEKPKGAAPTAATWGDRRKMPAEVPAFRRRFDLDGHKLYVHVGVLPSGDVGEVFFTSSAKEGTTLSGFLDALATMTSLALQHGAPLADVVARWKNTRFEPSGWTGDAEFPQATSFLDAVARWLDARFGPEGTETVRRRELAAAADLEERIGAAVQKLVLGDEKAAPRSAGLSAKLCPRGCGPMDQQGTCWRCPSCGTDSGACG